MKHLAKWWFIYVLICFGLSVTAGVTGWFDLAIERIMFKNSWQYQERLTTEETAAEAELAEINQQLQNSELTLEERNVLEARKASLEVIADKVNRQQRKPF